MTSDRTLQSLLACPSCHGELTETQQPDGLVCAKCKLIFAVQDGIANMLIEEAKHWPLTEPHA